MSATWNVTRSGDDLAEGAGAELEAAIRGVVLAIDPSAEVTFEGLTPPALTESTDEGQNAVPGTETQSGGVVPPTAEPPGSVV